MRFILMRMVLNLVKVGGDLGDIFAGVFAPFVSLPFSSELRRNPESSSTLNNIFLLEVSGLVPVVMVSPANIRM